MIVTIHDVTILHFDTGKASTLPLFLYKIRRLGYLIALGVGLRRVGHILTVSKATKQEIIDHFHIASDKITVTYESFNGHQIHVSQVKPQSKVIRDSYFLYVGNAYPHKNLENLLIAYQKFLARTNDSKIIKQKLVFVGKIDFFYQRLIDTSVRLGLSRNIIFFGEASQFQLKYLYQHATALIHPSLMEGFGLPNIEALFYDCPVICSDIPVFHEILGDLSLYFNPYDADDLANSLVLAIQMRSKLRSQILRTRDRYLARLSWKKMALQTYDIYCKLLQ